MKSNDIHHSMIHGRTGKIARLPHSIRQQLNHRLEDGESSQELVAWLNEQELVRERVAQYFGGRPITEQNLSDWKRGGFLDWQRHQETRGMVREFLSELEKIEDELGGEELLEKVTSLVTVALTRLFREAMAAESGPEQRKALLEIARELARLRRGHQQQKKVELLIDRRDGELEDWAEKRQEKHEKHLQSTLLMGTTYRRRYLSGMADGTLTPEELVQITSFFALRAEELEVVGVPPLPGDEAIEAAKAKVRTRRTSGGGGKAKNGHAADPE